MAEKMKDAGKAAKDAATREGKVHLALLVDESGSMQGLEEDVVAGAQEFIHEFKERKRTRIWLAFFDAYPGSDYLRVKVRAKKPTEVNDFTQNDYKPRGLTPLNDAVLGLLSDLDTEVKDDESVFMVIITDGQENRSEVKDPKVVAAEIEKYEKKGWGFLYLGADVRAEMEGAAIGVLNVFNFNKTKGGVRAATRAAGRTARSFGAGGQSAAYSSAKMEYDQTQGILPDEDGDDPHPGPGEPTSGTQDDD